MPAPQSWAARRATTVHTSLTMMLSSQVLSSPRWCRMARTCSRARQSLGVGETGSGQSHTRGAGGPSATPGDGSCGSPLRVDPVLELSSGAHAHPTGPCGALLSVMGTQRNGPLFQFAQFAQAAHCYHKTGTQEKRKFTSMYSTHLERIKTVTVLVAGMFTSFISIISLLFTGQQDKHHLLAETLVLSAPPPGGV